MDGALSTPPCGDRPTGAGGKTNLGSAQTKLGAISPTATAAVGKQSVDTREKWGDGPVQVRNLRTSYFLDKLFFGQAWNYRMRAGGAISY